MRLLEVTPMLTVDAIEPAVRFYTEVLGFAVVARMPGWACVGRDGVEVMFALPNAHVPYERPLLTGSLYFNVDDADAWWERLKNRCVVEYPIEDFEYGMREFAVRDCFGYLLQFGRRIG